MKKYKFMIVFAIMMILTYGGIQYWNHWKETSYDHEIRRLYKEIIALENQQEWTQLAEYSHSGIQEYDRERFSSPDYIRSCIQSAKLCYLRELPFEHIDPLIMDNDKYSNCTDWKLYMAGIEYEVSEVGYYYNGINFENCLFGYENGEWKIVMRGWPRYPDILLDYYEMTKDKKEREALLMAYVIRKFAWGGGKMDGDGTIIEDIPNAVNREYVLKIIEDEYEKLGIKEEFFLE